MKFFKILSISLLLAFGISACNTIGGIGKDLESGGETLRDAAN